MLAWRGLRVQCRASWGEDAEMGVTRPQAKASRPRQKLEGTGSRLSPQVPEGTNSASGLRRVGGPSCSFPSQLLPLCDSGPGKLMAAELLRGLSPRASHVSARGGPSPWSRGGEARRATHSHAGSDADGQGPRPRLPAAQAQGQWSPRGSPRLSRLHSPPLSSFSFGHSSSQGPVLCVTAPWEAAGTAEMASKGESCSRGARGECSVPRKGPSSARHVPAATQPVPGRGSWRLSLAQGRRVLWPGACSHRTGPCVAVNVFILVPGPRRPRPSAALAVSCMSTRLIGFTTCQPLVVTVAEAGQEILGHG